MMAPLISVTAEMLLPDQTWDKGRFSLLSDRIVFEGKSRKIDQTFQPQSIQCKREMFQRRKLLFSRDYAGVSFSTEAGMVLSFCFEDDTVPNQIIAAIDIERVLKVQPEELKHDIPQEPSQDSTVSEDTDDRAITGISEDKEKGKTENKPIEEIQESGELFPSPEKETGTAKEENSESKPTKKKKLNLKDATKRLVSDTKELLDVVTPIRKEADHLYDELKALQKSLGISDSDQDNAQTANAGESELLDNTSTTIQSTDEVTDAIPVAGEENISIYNQDISNAKNTSMRFGIGSIVKFGEYKHVPLKWLIIRDDEKGYLLLSLEIVAQKEFNKSFGVWSNCELKKWLNSTFRKKAFSEEEASYLYVGPTISLGSSTNQPPAAQLFVLSDEEYKEIVPDDYRIGFARRNNGDQYATKWWLRTSGETTKFAYYVDEKGNLISGSVSNDKIGVRPAMWVANNQFIVGESVISTNAKPFSMEERSIDSSGGIIESLEKQNGKGQNENGIITIYFRKRQESLF